MSMAQCVAVCITFILQIANVAAKFQTGTLVLSDVEPDQQWQYLSKFGYGIGVGDYSFRLRFHEPKAQARGRQVNLHYDVFLDEDWTNVQGLPLCQRAKEGPARARRPIRIPVTGRWGDWSGGEVTQNVRSHIWYFALSSCNQKGSNPLNGTFLVDYEFRAQDGGSEFSVEMQYMLPVSVAGLLVFSVFLIIFAGRCLAFRRSVGSVHVVVWILTAAMLLQFGGQVFEIMHLWRFSDDGVGAQTFDTISQVLLMMSQVVQTTLLISIALGYTLLHATLDELALVKPMTFVVCVIHAVLVAIGKAHGDSHFKYHENEGLVGWVLLAMRLALYIWFVLAVKESQQKGGFRLQAFLQQFRTAGSVYFLAYPVLFVVVQVFAPYLQHPIMQTGLLTMQTGSHFWLASLFLSRGNYFKASVLGSSVLPGGSGFCVLPQKES